MSAAEAIAPEQSVDEVRQSLSVTDKGKTAITTCTLQIPRSFTAEIASSFCA